MDTLHSVLRSIRGETKTRPDHVGVFREFLNHLDRMNRRGVWRAPMTKRVRPGEAGRRKV
ncbi:MAG: hypothetical protein HY056_08255 [Proteobacteria bacterium]|nr:hypothetical protein [Pseudomonadota bacterium]